MSIDSLGDGNINDTYLVSFKQRPPLVIQRLNGAVFPDPGCVASNVAMITAYLGTRLKATSAGCESCRFPEALETTTGRSWFQDQSGEVWRCLTYIDNAVSHPMVVSKDQPHEAGRLLGCFHALLEDFDGSLLCEPLPGFHDLLSYITSYLSSISSHRRALTHEFRYCRKMIDDRLENRFLDERAKEEQVCQRVIHGDPKCDNFLFDVATNRAVSLIDLDTTSNGLLAVDLGDCLRSFCNVAGEKGHSDIVFDTQICTSLLAGYFQSCLVAQDERYLIYHGVRQLTYELGLRFFTDHLNDDSYFKVTREGENLHRACVQFKLLESIEKQRPAIEKAAGIG
ncbi:MAG: phosphotransferase enzyme family protein [Desulfocapsaceae bacterium]